MTLENVSVAIDLIPIVGNIKAGEVISGYDPITGVRLEGPDYVPKSAIGIIVGGEFKQVGKIAGKGNRLEAAK
ncbi:pre-toxin TG domain-containing protein [Paenibacillus larvae]|nr:pre-toxin TG domain-containing protein [Paenibacillus larvae]